MSWDLKKHGDPVERECFDFIKANIPYYISIWCEYIGNDGCNNLVPIKNLPLKLNNKRHSFALYIYTCFESLILLNKILVKSNKDISNIDDYLNELNSIIAFHSNLGRIRDIIHKAYTCIGLIANKNCAIEKLYRERSIHLHEFKLPYSYNNKSILISNSKGRLIKEIKDNKKLYFNAEEFVYISDYYKNCLLDITKEVNIIFGQFYVEISRILKDNHCILESPKKARKKSKTISIGVLGGTSYIEPTNINYFS